MKELETPMTEESRDRNMGPLKAKRAYAPPSVTKVPLRPEEAVLGFCKSEMGGGPMGSKCNSIKNCSLQGS